MLIVKVVSIVMLRSSSAIRKLTLCMLGNVLVTKQTGPAGRKVNKLYVCTAAEIKKELYCAILLDRATSRPIFMDLEGTEICEWLNSIGVTGILLKYRVPIREGQERYLAPLQDAQRTVSLVRSHAKEWGIDPQRIGIMPFHSRIP